MIDERGRVDRVTLSIPNEVVESAGIHEEETTAVAETEESAEEIPTEAEEMVPTEEEVPASIQLRPLEIERYLARLRLSLSRMPEGLEDYQKVNLIFRALGGLVIRESGGPVSYPELDLSNPDNLGAVMQVLFRHYRRNDAVPVLFLARVQDQTGRQPVTRPEDVEQLLRIRRPHPAAQAIGLAPTLYMIIMGTEALGEQVQASSTAFYQGLRTGMIASGIDMSTVGQLYQRLIASSLLTTAFPVVYAGGTAAGIYEEGVESVSDIVEIATNFDSFVNGIETLIGDFLRSPENANAMGVACGQQLGARTIQLASSSIIRFTYELGKLMGPFIVSTILAFLFPELSLARLPVLFSRLRHFRRVNRMRRHARLPRRRQPDTPERRRRQVEEPETPRLRGPLPGLQCCRIGSLYCLTGDLERQFADIFRERLNPEFAPYIEGAVLPDCLYMNRSLRRSQRILTGEDMYVQYLRQVDESHWTEPFRDAMDRNEHGYLEIYRGDEHFRWPRDEQGQVWRAHHEPGLGWVSAEGSHLWYPMPQRVHIHFDSIWRRLRSGIVARSGVSRRDLSTIIDVDEIDFRDLPLE